MLVLFISFNDASSSVKMKSVFENPGNVGQLRNSFKLINFFLWISSPISFIHQLKQNSTTAFVIVMIVFLWFKASSNLNVKWSVPLKQTNESRVVKTNACLAVLRNARNYLSWEGRQKKKIGLENNICDWNSFRVCQVNNYRFCFCTKQPRAKANNISA